MAAVVGLELERLAVAVGDEGVMVVQDERGELAEPGWGGPDGR